jgi:hypothetical protein
MKGSVRALFDDIAGLLQRARLEKNKPALEQAKGFLESAKGQLHGQLEQILSGAKKNASDYLAGGGAAAEVAESTAKTEKTIHSQEARIAGIVIKNEIAENNAQNQANQPVP